MKSLATIFGLACCLLCPLLEAQGDEPPAPGVQTRAQTLFDEALRLMDAGDPARACPLLEQSHALDAALGTLFQLAQCYEGLGRTASAWRTYEEVARIAQMTGQADKEAYARARAEGIAAQVTKLSLRLHDRTVPGLIVTLDGTPVPLAAFDDPVPVDPGTHVVELRAPGRVSWRREVRVASAGKMVRLSAPHLKQRPVPAAPLPASTRPTAEGDGGGAQRLSGWVVGSVGAGALTAGAVLAVVSKVRYDGASTHCDGNLCNQEGFDTRNTARVGADVATGLLIGGAAACAGGVVLWLTAPEDAPVTMTLTPSAVSLRGRW